MNNLLWEIKQDNDDLYIGTYPRANIYHYNITTGNLINLGSVWTRKNYTRTVEKYNNKLYLGIGARAQLVEYDLDSKTFTNILPRV